MTISGWRILILTGIVLIIGIEIGRLAVTGGSVDANTARGNLTPWFELAYYITGPLLVGISLYGLKQLGITKRDVEIRNERAAKEKALEYASRFATVVIPLGVLCREKLRSYPWGLRCTVTDFTQGSVPAAFVEPLTVIQAGDSGTRLEITNLINELQTIAAAFYTGVADEETGYKIIGDAFCESIEQYYPFICLSRGDVSKPLWIYIIELDAIWRGRREKHLLELSRQNIDNRISSMPVKQADKIGKTTH